MVSNEQFLSVVFGVEADRAHVTAFDGDPADEEGAGRFRWVGGWARSTLARCTPTRNNYYVVSTFNRSEDNKERRRKADFRAMHVVVVDDVTTGPLGDGRKVNAEIVLRTMGPPTFRIETSPDNEQWGYAFREPLTDRYEAEILVEEMIRRGLTEDRKDPGMRGVTRYVRMPVGTNCKSKYGPGGFKTRLTEWEPARKFCPYELGNKWNVDIKAMARMRREIEARNAASRVNPEADDPLRAALFMLDLVRNERRDGIVDITCPFIDQHGGRADTGTALMPDGGIACHHGHCVGRARSAYVERVCTELHKLKTDEASALIKRFHPSEVRRKLCSIALGRIRRINRLNNELVEEIKLELSGEALFSSIETDKVPAMVDEAFDWALDVSINESIAQTHGAM